MQWKNNYESLETEHSPSQQYIPIHWITSARESCHGWRVPEAEVSGPSPLGLFVIHFNLNTKPRFLPCLGHSYGLPCRLIWTIQVRWRDFLRLTFSIAISPYWICLICISSLSFILALTALTCLTFCQFQYKLSEKFFRWHCASCIFLSCMVLRWTFVIKYKPLSRLINTIKIVVSLVLALWCLHCTFIRLWLVCSKVALAADFDNLNRIRTTTH
jgi:hypothetical protein